LNRLESHLRWLLLLIAITSLFASAEQGILTVHVKDVQGRPVQGLEIGTEGDGSSAITDRAGVARLRLAPHTRSGTSLSLQIVTPLAGKDLVIISPWDNRIRVPPFENGSDNFEAVVVADRGDRAILENGTALTAIVSKINRANSTSLPKDKTKTEQRRVLAEVSKVFGLTPDEVDEAIRAWGRRTADPSQQELATTYEKTYPILKFEYRLSFINVNRDFHSSSWIWVSYGTGLARSSYLASCAHDLCRHH